MDNKIVKVIFKEGWETMYNNDLTQSDYGQVLQIEGLMLPDGNVEVHFSLTEYNGEAPVFIGAVKDNVITVNIPDFILAKENVYQPTYEAYAWIYVTDGESGRTIRKIVFTINTRAEPTTNVPEAQQDQFLQEVRQVMAETKEIAQSVRDDADNGKFGGGTNITVDAELSEESENPVQNKVIAKEVIALQNKNKDLEDKNTELEETIEKLQIKVTTDKSPYHHITDSANMKVLDFGMEGITEQKTTSGKNKLNTSNLVEKTASGIKFTPVYTNGMLDYVLVNGTATSTISYLIGSCDDDYLSVEKLTFNGCPSGGSTSTYMLVHITSGASDIGNGMNQTCSYLRDLNYAIKIMGGTTVSNLKFYPMVRLATETDATYEPYSDMPVPNPDCQQEVKLAGVLNEETGRYEHKCVISDESEEKSQPFTLTSDRPLTKWDNLVKRDGVWGWGINSRTLRTDDENEYYNNMYINTYENNICTLTIYDKKPGIRGNSYCDCFRNVGEEDAYDGNHKVYEYSDHGNPKVLAMYFVTECYSRDEWIAWLKEHPLTFVYQTAEEQAFIPLPEEEQTLLNNLETYYGVTNVYNEQGCPMWLEYVTDTKLYVDQKLLEIQQAII